MNMNNVLIVDDSDDVRLTLSIILEDAGYDVLEAENGRQAISAVQSSQPDVILMDIEMPVLNGLVALSVLKADTKTREVPVVMMSANSQRGTINKALAAGAASYVTKPFHLEEIVQAVETAISSHR